MKDSHEVINHLYFSNSQKLRQARCLNILKALLPPRLGEAISYIYKNNQKLFIVIDQFGLKMEFNYKRDLIKSLLKSIHKESSLCEDLYDCEVVISVSNKKREAARAVLQKHVYAERAEGDFENLAQDEEIKGLIEKIRSTIKTNRS